MEERKKIKVAIHQHDNQQSKHQYEPVMTPRTSKSTKYNLKKWSIIKSALLALVLGAVFGIGILYYFDMTTPPTSDEATAPVASNDESDELDQSEPASTDTSTTYSGGVYDVVQLGVFSTEENANSLKRSRDMIPSIVTERDGNYYVLASLIHPSQSKQEIIDGLNNVGLTENEGYYVTSWTFDDSQISSDHAALSWLEEGLSLLEPDTLSEQWEEDVTTWLGNYPTSMSDDKLLNQAINIVTMSDDGDRDTSMHRATLLLTLHLLYDSIS
ncbi:hypothetical protein ABID56_000629 [Alkalibacillus flavidus]|uniref:SPOR domain-containing protein n=1 Tax=Alkalibacillus flavidus TaxID=546021 RepID=A0ABV2KSJ1_9BACI